tara:strand:- start:940 stop:1155 length:216 start_codon:yes stop_codon:yes gene_type:complete
MGLSKKKKKEAKQAAMGALGFTAYFIIATNKSTAKTLRHERATGILHTTALVSFMGAVLFTKVLFDIYTGE